MLRIPLALLPLLLAATVSAQETTKPAASGITLRALAEVVPDDLGAVYLAMGEARGMPFELPVNNLSDPLTAPGRELVLKTVKKDLPLCKFSLPSEGRRFVVIFSPAKPSGYTAHAVRVDAPGFAPGDVFFLNRTEQTILGKLGTKALVLQPGKSAISRPEGATEGAYYDIAFAARTSEGDKILSTVRWPVDERVRSYVFFVHNADGGVTYRAVDEFVPVAKPGQGG
jgi:hypothetical protein